MLSAFLLLLGTTLTGVRALEVETKEAFFDKLNSYVESLEAANATYLSSEQASGVTKEYETMALFFYQQFFDSITQHILPPLCEQIYNLPLPTLGVNNFTIPGIDDFVLTELIFEGLHL